jgi:hypothetical protein
MALPTEDQVREAFKTWLRDVHHAATRASLGGLSPRLAMEQRRAHIERIPAEVAELVCSSAETEKGAPRLRTYGRDGITSRGWLFRERDEHQHFRLIGRKVVVRRVSWTGDYLILTDEAGTVISRPRRVTLVGVSATPDELREVAREQNRARRVVRRAGEARRFLFGTRAQQLAELKRGAALAAEAEVRRTLPAPPQPEVTIIAANVASKAQLLRATGTGGAEAAARASAPPCLPPAQSALARLAALADEPARESPPPRYAVFTELARRRESGGAAELRAAEAGFLELLGEPGDEPTDAGQKPGAGHV